MMIFLLTILFLSLILFLVSKYLARKFAFKDNQPQTFEDIYNSDVKVHGVKYETFSEVYKALEENYSIDLTRIRPRDSLKKFFDLDSWELGIGTDRMNEWLSKTYGIKEKQENIDTVLDLLIIVEKRRKKNLAL